MKISCQSCQAKYTIADEKVLGKIVKIRCKKCSATIVINGNETAAPSSAPMGDGQDPNNVFDYTQQSGGGEQWTVNVADGDQRTLTSHEISDAYKQGVVNEETYCWKDGMSDWLPLREIEALYAICTMEARPSLSPDGGHHHDEGPTRVQESNLGALFGGAGLAAATSPMPALGSSPPPAMESNGNGMGLYAAPAPAARRAGGRGNQGADLFSGVSHAGGEEEVMTSAPTGMPQVHDDPSGKLTGQRNENSVLFSLATLTNNAPKESVAPPTGEGSGLIDIRALSASMEKKDDRPNRVDDIMNLAGGGAFTPALAAPVLAPPAMDGGLSSMGLGAEQGKSNKTLLIAILGGATLIAIAIVVVAIVMKSPDLPPPAAGTVTTTTMATGTGASTGGTATATTSTATAATTTTDTTPSADTSATATASSTAPVATAAKTKVPVVPTAKNPATAAVPPTTQTTAPAATTAPKVLSAPCGCAPGDLDCAINCGARSKKKGK